VVCQYSLSAGYTAINKGDIAMSNENIREQWLSYVAAQEASGDPVAPFHKWYECFKFIQSTNLVDALVEVLEANNAA